MNNDYIPKMEARLTQVEIMTINRTYLYFAYGSNLNLELIDRRCPGIRPLTPAILKDYELVFRGVADVISAPGKIVIGAIYEVNESHLQALDQYEGIPHFYERRLVEVETMQGEKLQALTYMITQKTAPYPPSEHYLHAIIAGMKQWNFPPAYIEEILSNWK